MDKLFKFGIVAFAVSAATLAASAWIACGFVLTTDAMAPKLHEGDTIFINRLSKSVPKRGTLMLIRVPGTETQIIRRLIALPGDKIKIENCQVFINETSIPEPYLRVSGVVQGELIPLPIFFGPITVESDGLFFLADTRDGVTDSREFGSVKEEHLLGKVWCLFGRPVIL